jgi:uncharacterized protein YbjT (DUF2867 family)
MVMTKQKTLLAGATGYLGSFLTQELVSKNYDTRIIVRNKHKVSIKAANLEVVEAEVTKPETLKGICKGINTVISTVGITRQKDGLTYMDVDFQANANLIDEAKENGVKKFIYVSVLNGEKIRHTKGGAAKEKLVDYLKSSGLDYCIVRPNGFFSDMGDFLTMAKRGRVYLFGDGELKLNPIHGKDLAHAIVDSIDRDIQELNIGGPDMLTQNDLAALALKAQGNPVKITHLPDWIRRTVLWIARTFTNQKTYGPIEFFMTTMVMDMQAPLYGKEKLEDFFKKVVENSNNNKN